MLGWAIVYPVLMFEGLGAFEAMSRSRKLMVGHKGKALVLMFLVGIASLCLGVIAGIVPNYYFAALVQQAFNSLAIVFNSVVVTVLYFSARCHAENFDLELLAEIVESKAPAPEAAL